MNVWTICQVPPAITFRENNWTSLFGMPAPLNCWTLFESDIETADISRLSRIALNKDFDRNDLFMGTLIKKSE